MKKLLFIIFIIFIRFFILINFVNVIYSLHLNNLQITLIRNLIQNPELKYSEKEKIKMILYNAYEKWAIKKALDFKALHKYKCMNMKKEEFIFSSKIGLYKSIQKYNGKYDFINYSKIYINSELLKLLTDKYSLCSLPKSYRSKSQKQKQKQNQIKSFYWNHYLLNVKLTGHYEKWQLDSIFVSKEQDIVSKINNKYEKIEKIEKIEDDFMKRVLYLKYYFYNGDKSRILSNKEISVLMCCSEETIRENLKHVI